LRRSARGEEGAVVPFVAVVLVVLLLCAALATDIGLQRVARSDMQALADTVALDLARELDGRDVTTLQPLIGPLATASRDRSDGAVGDDATMSVQLGELDPQGSFVPLTGGAVPTAVRVTARTEVDFAFAGVTGVDDGAASRSAVGVAELGACFRVGSFVARLDSTTSPLLNVLLGTLLGSDVSLSAVDYNGVAGAEVTLLELVEVGGLGVGSVQELLELEQLSVGELYVALARVLTDRGQLVAASVLERIGVAAATPTIALADLVTAAPTDRAALEAGLNVLDLVTGAAYAAGAGHSLVVDDLGIPGLLGATLVVTEAPQVGCGGPGTRAATAQVRLTVPVSVPASTLTLPGFGSVTLGATSLAVTLDLGRAVAELLDVRCGPLGAEELGLRLASSIVGAVAVTGSTRATAHLQVTAVSDLLGPVLGLLGLTRLLAAPPSIDLDVSIGVSAGTLASSYSSPVRLPLPAAYTTPVGRASGVVLGDAHATPGVGATIRLTVPQLLGPPTVTTLDAGPVFAAVLGPVSGLVETLVNPLLRTVQTALVAPLSDLLGLQLAGADVWALPEPACGGPQLRQ